MGTTPLAGLGYGGGYDPRRIGLAEIDGVLNNQRDSAVSGDEPVFLLVDSA